MQEVEIAQLKTENARLQIQHTTDQATIAELLARVAALENQLAQNSDNSHKPPSSDPYSRPPKTRSLRKASGKKAGGQKGHEGKALCQRAQPNIVVDHYPSRCEGCQRTLDHSNTQGYQKRQVLDLPPTALEVTEHRAHWGLCPECHHLNQANFPNQVSNWVQYGPGFRALALYLLYQQLLPYARVCEILNELFSESLSSGTLALMVKECYDLLAAPEAKIKSALSHSEVLHNDETSIRVETDRVWLHVASTPQLTHYGWHKCRGKTATNAIGIMPNFKGISVHDGFKSYAANTCQHALCNAHHLRELTFVSEQLGQDWAEKLKSLLCELKAAVEQAQAQGLSELEASHLVKFELSYYKLLHEGLLANPPPLLPIAVKKRGKPKQSKAKNLLDRLFTGQNQVFAFAYNFKVPFDNNQAERDLRMVKVQQKVSGCFRSSEGATLFCRIRSYLSSIRKQGASVLLALLHTFCGKPPLPACLT